MTLFEEFESEKDSSELLPVDEQVCAQFFYFSIRERDEFKALMKKAIPDLLDGVEPNKWSLSDGVLALLRKHYGDE